MTRITSNVGRTLLNGLGGRTTEGQEQQLRTQASPPTIQRAVVVDVITDPATLTQEIIDTLKDNVSNPEIVPILPTNSVIAKIVSNNNGVSAQKNIALFPMFSSHIMLPVKPGEHVYAIFEDAGYKNNKLGYWIARPTSPGTIEDANYTHYDRFWDPTSNPENYSTNDQTKKPNEAPPYSFQNGGGTDETATLSANGLPPDTNPYDAIVRDARATPSFVQEPVPRWKKRPGELVLQGSNNSLIVLGTDRNGPVADGNETKRDAAAIDIVVGRGRYKAAPGQYNSEQVKYSTAPIVANTIRGDGTTGQETDKATYRFASTNIPDVGNPNEGNPSPLYDAARLLITQQSEVDTNYGISTAQYPSQALAPQQPVAEGNLGKSYVAAKADNIRIIARKNEDVNGTIFIGKEGTKNSSSIGSVPSSALVRNDAGDPNGDLAYIFINSQGQMQVEGNKIIIGRGSDNKEPYIRYSYYEVQINELKTQIKALADLVQKMGTTYDLAFSTAIAIPFSPVASLASNGIFGATTVAPTVTQIKTQVDSIHPEDAKSKKIFGE